LAQGATATVQSPPQSVLLRVAARTQGRLLPIPDYFRQSTTGQFTRKLDKALPGRHTRRLYDKLVQEDAVRLCQLRTGRCRLNGYLARVNAVASELCVCGRPETVRHYLIECTRWQDQRAALRQVVGQRWTDLSYLLGGWVDVKGPDGRLLDGRRENWKPDLTAVAATLVFIKDTARLERDEE